MALEEAEKALKENTYPVGAVIVDGNNNVIARGRNRVHPQKDITAHAETLFAMQGKQCLMQK